MHVYESDFLAMNVQNNTNAVPSPYWLENISQFLHDTMIVFVVYYSSEKMISNLRRYFVSSIACILHITEYSAIS